MKRKLVVLNLFISIVSFSQNLEWVNTYGGAGVASGTDVGYAIAVDDLENVYTVGRFTDTMDFDPGLGSTVLDAGVNGVFIQKSSSNGDLIWAKSLEEGVGNEYATANDLTIDNNGDIIVVGQFRGTIDFDPSVNVSEITSSSVTYLDAYILKLDSDGNFLWVKNIEAENGMPTSVATDFDNNIITAGYFWGTADFDPSIDVFNLTSSGADDSFVQKLNSDGDFLWAKSVGNSQYTRAFALDIDLDGNLYIGGYYQATVDFDPSSGVSELTSMLAGTSSSGYLLKLNDLGEFVWVKGIEGNGYSNVTSIGIDNESNLFVGGGYTNTIDFELTTSSTSQGGLDIYIQQLDTAGNFNWGKTFGGINNDRLKDIDVGSGFGIYISGTYEDLCDFDPSVNTDIQGSNGLEDAFALKLNSIGEKDWVSTFGGTGYDRAEGISVSNLGSVFITGSFENTVDFNSDPLIIEISSANSGIDAFVEKIKPCDITEDIIVSCDNFTWIDDSTYTESTMAYFIMLNNEGCDSLIKLDLTINSPNVLTTTTDPSITANASGASYQWLDCDNNNAVITGETNQLFTANSNGNYAVEITNNGCTDTSDCVMISTVGFNDNLVDSGIQCYPNPFKNNIVIYIPNPEKTYSIKIININGELIHVQQISKSSNQISTSEFNNGIYFIQIYTEDFIETRKIVKQ